MRESYFRSVSSVCAAGLLAAAVGCGPEDTGTRNVSPVNESLSAEPKALQPGGESTLRLRAYDPDGVGQAGGDEEGDEAMVPR